MFNIRKITCMNYDRYKILNKAMKRKKKGESTKPSTGKVLTE